TTIVDRVWGRSQKAHAVPPSARTPTIATPRGSQRPNVLPRDHRRADGEASAVGSVSRGTSDSMRCENSFAGISVTGNTGVGAGSFHAARRARAQLAAVLAAARTAVA